MSARVGPTDPHETQKLALEIVEASRDVERCRALVDSLTGDQIVGLARAASASSPPWVQNLDVFTQLLMRAMTDAVCEDNICQIQAVITPPGAEEPRTCRVVVLPEAMTFRTSKKQPLGARRAPRNQ